MPRTSPAVLTLVASLAALTTLAACSDAAQRAVAPPTAPELSKASSAQSGDVTVMEYNLYQGTELPHILQRASGSSAAGAATDYETMLRTNFPERAGAIARAIDSAGADLVGLSEVALWRTGPHVASGSQPPATEVTQDFVQILIAALEADHLHYAVVSSVNNFDVQATAQLSTGLREVRLTDRTVIIARQDKGGAALKYTNPQAANFTVNSPVETANGSIPLLEGWASVDVKKHGQPFRFIATHLDPFSSTTRVAQASEVVSKAANTSYPVIVVGDMNATPGSAPYNAFVHTGGFGDVWGQLRPSDAGFTCCQVTEEIRNPASTLNVRIDYVFARGALQPVKIQEYGDTPAWRTTSGLWPSDHAGLAATFSRKGGD